MAFVHALVYQEFVPGTSRVCAHQRQDLSMKAPDTYLPTCSSNLTQFPVFTVMSVKFMKLYPSVSNFSTDKYYYLAVKYGYL